MSDGKDCNCGPDLYRMQDVMQPFDTLDDLIERLTFVNKTLAEQNASSSPNGEITSALLIIAREVKALKEANNPKETIDGARSGSESRSTTTDRHDECRGTAATVRHAGPGPDVV